MTPSWKNLIIRIGEKCPEYGGTLDFKEHIDTCYTSIWRELDTQVESELLNFLFQCAEQLPHKAPLYSTLIGLLNLEKEDLGKLIVDTTHSNLHEAISSENCDKIRVLLRFLTVLMCSKVVQSASLVVLFETLLSSACTIVDEEKGNPAWQPRADFYIACVLTCLPWGGAELMEQVPEEIDRVLVGIQAYFSIRKHILDFGFSIFVDNDRAQRANELNKDERLALSEDLIAMVRGRQSAREVITWVEESVMPVHGLDDTLQVVIPTLLNIGSKSFTHLITFLERYGQVIAKMCPDEDRQVMLINEVSTFWKNSTQMTSIAIDRMMGYRLISNLAIVRWVFSPTNAE